MRDRHWNRYVSGLLSVAALLAAASQTGCVSAPDDEEVGVVRVAITSVPADVRCIRLTAAGSRTVSRLFDVVPGTSSVLVMNGTPLGAVQFSGDAFGDACGAVTPASAATWSSDPVTMQVASGVVADVTLVMRRTGRAQVNVDFQDDTPMCTPAGVKCLAGGPACCPGLVCDPTVGVCQPQAPMCAGPMQPCFLPPQPPQCCAGLSCTAPAPGIPGFCQPPQQPTCTDGIFDGSETDVDCGGPTCAPCSLGRGCKVPTDCAGGVSCVAGICQPPACQPKGTPCMTSAECCSGTCSTAPGMPGLCL